MRILLVEDDPVSRRCLEHLLQSWGEEVTSTESALDALRLFREGMFSLVITDWMMPEMDGLELIRRIRAMRRAEYVYTVIVSSKGKKADLVEAMDVGADDFLRKPYDADELRMRLKAGERVVALEHQLAEQNRTLRQALATRRKERKDRHESIRTAR